MKLFFRSLGALMVGGGIASASPPVECPIPGNLKHWQADYCMAELETDDVIAASACLERELQMRFRSPCNGKHRYKHAMCQISVSAGAYPGPIEACLRDPFFVGPTVRNGGA